jgi:hypothetical protein
LLADLRLRLGRVSRTSDAARLGQRIVTMLQSLRAHVASEGSSLPGSTASRAADALADVPDAPDPTAALDLAALRRLRQAVHDAIELTQNTGR